MANTAKLARALMQDISQARDKVVSILPRGIDSAFAPRIPMGHTAFSWEGVDPLDRSGASKAHFSTSNAHATASSSSSSSSSASSSSAPKAAPATAAAPAAAAAGSEESKETPAKGGKNKGGAAAKAGAGAGAAAGAGAGAGADSQQSDISKMNFLVGKIVDCKRHDNADSLYVEQIDLGEASGPRTIVSGLVKYIPLDKMIGASCVVVANLKPSDLRGVTSQGMVLAAKSADGSTVDLVAAPAGTSVGERLVLEGEDWKSAAPEANVDPKKKNSTWSKVASLLSTNAAKEFVFNGAQRFVSSVGPAASPSIANGIVS